MPDSAYYLWEPPGRAATVELSLAVVDGLNSLIRQTTVFVESETSRRPLETGAILIGSRLESGAITVDDFEEIPCEHQRGASFTLSLAERVRLGHRLGKLTKHGRTVVGYFRIHTRPGMYLDHDDDLAIRQFFSQSWHVVLLAKPQASAPPEACFFFWNQGDMDRRQAILPFPLDRDALRAEGHRIISGPQPAPGAAPPASRPPRRNWVPVAGAVALFALAAVFIPTGVSTAGRVLGRTHRTPAAPIAEAPAVSNVPDTWPAPDEVQSLNAAAIRPPRHAAQMTPPATHRSAIAPVRVETAVGPAPGREEIAMAAPPPVYHTPLPATVLPKPRPVQNDIRPEVSLEPVRRSVLRTTIGHIPLIGNLGHVRNETNDDFVPARPRRERAPTVPLELSRELRRDEPVLLRIRIAKSGEVSGTELLSRDSNPIFASIALHAASTWDFEPARLKNKAVPSDMLVHFRFPAAR